jgi:EAL domain-containing protein (putative c-di-GMP-specific phosphodiesterase class I)/CheY-like chemotaxis protein
MRSIAELMVALGRWFGTTERAARGRSPEGESLPPSQADALCFIVDGEVDIRRLVSMALTPMSIQIEEFGSAQSLLEALSRRHPQIIFLDASLERSDAVKALGGLAKAGYSGAIVLMGGRNGQILEDVRALGERQGLRMLPALVKPFDIGTVREIGFAQFATASQTTQRVSIDEALRRGWMKVWYQPKIDLKRNVLAGYEALARIDHPERGILLPGTFLSGSSRESLARLTEHVLLTVLRDHEKFRKVGAALQPAINVPADVLLNFPLVGLMRENQPKDEEWKGLIIEVTEEQVVCDVTRAQELAEQLRTCDVTLAIDDFGMGYSSLSRLRHFPFVELKLDMSLVQNCARSAQGMGLCKAAIDLAHSFNASAVAEGIEAADDLHALFRMDCDMGQGFFLAPPAPLERLFPVLQQREIRQTAEERARGSTTILQGT